MAKTKTDKHAKQLDQLAWSVDTPSLLYDIIPNLSATNPIYRPIIAIFTSLLVEVAQRATELHDDKLDILMLRLNMYDMEGTTLAEKNKNRVNLITRLQAMIDKQQG